MKITPEILIAMEKMRAKELNSIEILGVSVDDSPITVAVSVTCHDAYLKYLPDMILSIENQTNIPDERFLVLDNCEIPFWMKFYPKWKIITTKFGSPNMGRNAVIEKTKCDWVCFADADDIMDENYIESVKKTITNANDNVAIIYADLNYLNKRVFSVPKNPDYWQLRISNYVSACSAWRVNALRDIGGYDLRTKCYDDWSTALKLTAIGWKTTKNELGKILVRSHGNNHRHENKGTNKVFPHLWNIRTYGILTLFAGRFECLSGWKHWILRADIPDNTTIYAYDNSRNPEFSRELISIINQIQLSGRYVSVNYITDYSEIIKYDKWDKHRHVNNLYNKILPKINDDMLLFFEDDINPPLDGLKKLVEKTDLVHNYAGVSGVYQSRSGRNLITAAFGTLREPNRGDFWHNIVSYNDLKGVDELRVGFIAGGFALYNNALVRRSLPMKFGITNGAIGGWDSHLSRFIRNTGHRLTVIPDVYCHHMVNADGDNCRI